MSDCCIVRLEDNVLLFIDRYSCFNNIEYSHIDAEKCEIKSLKFVVRTLVESFY